jgi:hypothetical protein
MKARDRITGLTLAAAAAAIFAATPVVANAASHASAEQAQGQCVGGNSCKGQSACKTAASDCQGQNACKGQGFTQSNKAECDEAGGEFEEA